MESSSKKSASKLFERFMVVFATIEPLATVPQIVKIWQGNTTGVSFVTWFFYSLTSAIWLVYGFKTNDKPIIVSGSLWVLSQGLVVIGLLIH